MKFLQKLSNIIFFFCNKYTKQRKILINEWIKLGANFPNNLLAILSSKILTLIKPLIKFIKNTKKQIRFIYLILLCFYLKFPIITNPL